MPEYDLVIIGGGIAGAAIARETAARGLRVAVLEKNTVGSGTSSRSSKLIHGGIRYLEVAWKKLLRLEFREVFKNLRFVFASLNEARLLEKAFPALVRPLPILLPLYRSGRKRALVFAGVFLYYLLARWTGPAKFPRFFWTKSSVLKTLPGLKNEGLMGGVLIWERIVDDAELTKTIMASAVNTGACLLEHTRVLRYQRTPANQYEIHYTANEEEFHLISDTLINATGPWVDRVRREAGPAAGAIHESPLLSPIAGAHIELLPFLPVSMLLEAEDGRFFFVILTGRTARVGTTERVCDNPDGVTPTAEEIDYLLRSLAFYFPERCFEKKDILCSDAGVRPLARGAGKLSNISREHAIHRDKNGVYHILGVKLTDHRRAAKDAIDRLFNKKSSNR